GERRGGPPGAPPASLGRGGPRAAPAAGAGHDCRGFTRPSGLLQPGRLAGARLVAVRGNLTADLGEGLVEAAAAGLGIIQAHDYMVAPAIAAGRLVPILAAFAAPGPPGHVLCAPGRQTSAKVRALFSLAHALLGHAPRRA